MAFLELRPHAATHSLDFFDEFGVRMHPFPHHYTVNAAVRPDGDVPLSTEGVRVIESSPPKEFDGPGNQWSPEGLLTAAVADCFALGFRAIARASKFEWRHLDVRTMGTLDRVDGKMLFTRFDTHAKLQVNAGADVERAKKLLEKAENNCLIANSLRGERHLTLEVTGS
jgi:peroxiredoxin-like protein